MHILPSIPDPTHSKNNMHILRRISDPTQSNQYACSVQGSVTCWEGSPQQSLYWSVSSDLGHTWSAHKLLFQDSSGLPVWGPVLHTEVAPPGQAFGHGLHFWKLVLQALMVRRLA